MSEDEVENQSVHEKCEDTDDSTTEKNRWLLSRKWREKAVQFELKNWTSLRPISSIERKDTCAETVGNYDLIVCIQLVSGMK